MQLNHVLALVSNEILGNDQGVSFPPSCRHLFARVFVLDVALKVGLDQWLLGWRGVTWWDVRVSATLEDSSDDISVRFFIFDSYFSCFTSSWLDLSSLVNLRCWFLCRWFSINNWSSGSSDWGVMCLGQCWSIFYDVCWVVWCWWYLLLTFNTHLFWSW